MIRIALILALMGVGAAQAQDSATAAAILEKYKSFRPAESELAIYRLAWVPTLKEAKERAAKEGRPVLLLVCTNSYGNLFTGHC